MRGWRGTRRRSEGGGRVGEGFGREGSEPRLDVKIG